MESVASSPLSALTFDNRFIRELPGDPETENQCRQVQGACFSRVDPVSVSAPRLVAYSQEMADSLGLSKAACLSEEFLEVFSGNRLLTGMEPYATCYGGHQFGNWAGQLGDGRAINLGEVVTEAGDRWVLQLKGAGPTPYSRGADGFAVTRSSVREFLCSEAMFHLGVPTTRALSLILTGDEVVRDMFYDGNPRPEPGAVVCRVAPSFTRFGSFQIFAARGDEERLRTLADYTIRTDFPHLGAPSKEVYLQWFEEVCRTTAEMIVHWMRVGFVHGVMNTDNMSILGQTIDYGPYGWLEDYDPNWTPNTTDAGMRRYRFGGQPEIAHWNLLQLAQAVHPLIDDVDRLQVALDVYPKSYLEGWKKMMAAKLGLAGYDGETDDDLTRDLFEQLQQQETDMTIFFRKLAEVSAEGEPSMLPLKEAFYVPEQATPEVEMGMQDWLGRYVARVRKDGSSDEVRRRRMNEVNPKYVLRNYMAQQAADKAEEGDFSLVNELLDLLRHPYDEQPDREAFAQKRPDWARHRAGCSMLSCSS